MQYHLNSILKAILALKHIAAGDSISGVKWTVDFETVTGQNFIWEGEFENKGLQPFVEEDDEMKKNKPKILKEKLHLNGTEIISRNTNANFWHANFWPNAKPSHFCLVFPMPCSQFPIFNF